MSLVFLFIITLTSSKVSGIIINELESNPVGKDSGNEWIELYSDTETSLEGYFLQNGDGGIFNLSGGINGYLVIMFQGLWLDNSNETVFLKLNGEVIDEVPVFADSKNNDMTFSFCNNEWIMKASTKGEDNSCDGGGNVNQDEEEDEEADNVDLDEITPIQNNIINNSISPSNLVEVINNKEIKQKIVLSKSLEAKEANSEVTSSYKIRIGIIYFFVGICILLVVLMALRKL